jgi:predicted TPR repeat methyltransferase
MRDTDADWRHFGETKPYFAVLTDPKFLPENLTKEARAEFFASGERDIASIVASIRKRIAADFRPSHAVDFGCGVGRLAFAMAKLAQRVTGVDVSPGMLREAEQQRALRRLDTVAFRSEIPDEPYDWVNSLIVLQHIRPDRGYGIIDQLLCGLSNGGVVSLQVTTHRDRRVLNGTLGSVDACRYDGHNMDILTENVTAGIGHMMMYDYDLGRVMAVFAGNGVEGAWLQHTDHGGHHGFHILGRKG